MDAKLKAKWAKALRSGKYKQGRHDFRNSKDNTYCCLGVLCVVARRAPTIGDGLGSNWTYVRKTIGGPDHGRGDQVMTLAHMNDGGKSFAEIAAYIDATL